ncbi:phospholipase C/P1 nuclease domain-containing protein [Terfezia claveryi]|nr:phospholipase C/P1 nuclease domain-containing protein [Terfezia claveryi]
MALLSHSLLPLILLAFAPSTLAWGQLPHRTIALLSTRFLLPETASFIRTILPKDETIAAAAIWGDYFSHTPEGRWSGPLHYIDAHDDPGNGLCGVQLARDCGQEGMCVVGGIIYFTLVIHTYTPAHLSLRLLLHLIADIHQPLHTENLFRGGNSLHVLFSGRDSNLHSTWDSLIPQSLRHGRTPRHAQLWADELFNSITSLPPATLRHWAGSYPQDKAQECAMEWARYTNSYICSYVFKDGVESMKGRELGGEYTENARDLVDELVGMAGWRLGGWLNLVVTGKLGLELGEAADVVEEVEGMEEDEDLGPVVNVGGERWWKGRMGGVLQRVGGAAQRVLGKVREVNWGPQ